MKKEFSFYEFVGILVPSTIFLFSVQLIIEIIYNKQIVDFGKIGESIIFFIICYGVGHLLQSLGNTLEDILWFIYGGKPTQWLFKKNRFGKSLFESPTNQRISIKVTEKFGDDILDYGRLAYNFIFQKGKTARVDIFNGNYSLFRGLAISFLLISGICGYFFNWEIMLLSLIPFILSIRRMIRFAKYYASEIFRTFYNMEELP